MKNKANKPSETKMGGEEFLSDMPKKSSAKKSKVVTKTMDAEKFLSTKEKKIKSFESFVNEEYNQESSDEKFNYQLLGRLQSDCEYFLGYGNGSENRLWAGNIEEQIAKMKELWNDLSVKPKWLTYEQIEDYERRMLDLRER